MRSEWDVTVKYKDRDPFTVTIDGLAVMEFERHFKVGLTAIATDTRMEYLYYLGWLAAKQAFKAGDHPGPIVATFEEFVGRLEDVPDIDEAGSSVPLDDTATSSGSPS